MESTSRKQIRDILISFTDEMRNIFKTPLDESFIIASYIISSKTLPVFNDLSESQNEVIGRYYNDLRELNYTVNDMRRAFSEAYLMSLREIKDYTVKVTLELPLMFLYSLTDLIASKTEYSSFKVLNASANNGSLALMLSESKHIGNDNLYVTVDTNKEERISTALRDLCLKTYPIDRNLPERSSRFDIIVSDPFLRKVEDILIYFEDYTEYLNIGSFFIIVLPTEYVRSRYFSDSLEKYSLCLIGLIEYPKDILEGLVQSSIIILEKKNGLNKEFFHIEMSSVKSIDENISALDAAKNYITEYLKDR